MQFSCQIFIDLTPLIPLSILGEGEDFLGRGADASLRLPIMYLGRTLLFYKKLSPSLIKGRGLGG
jgi:hypothetical protein